MPADAPGSTRTSADSRSDFIEQIFQKVEEESERRAQEQAQFEAQSAATQSRVASPPPPPLPPAAPAAVSVARDRRRGSISVSRFGQATDLATHTADSPSALPSRTNSVIINAGKTGAFYQAQKYAGSADSFASSHHSATAPAHAEEEQEGVTQMETIAGKVSIGKAMGGLIARRLSRSRTRSRDILATPSGLVIGVSVEEATTEAEHEHAAAEGAEGDSVPRTPCGTAIVYAQADGLRSRRSTLSMPGTSSSSSAAANSNSHSSGSEAAAAAAARANGGALEKRLSAAAWMAKARDLTKKFRRKSMAVLPQHPSP